MFHWKFHNEILSFLKFLGYCVINHVGFGAFLKSFIFYFWFYFILFYFLWCNFDNVGGFWNFDNVGNLWCCWMNFSLNFGSIGIAKTLYLIYMNVFMMYVGKLICMCKLCFMDVVKFCGYVHGYICGYWKILWLWSFDLWKILLGMWCWFLENLYGHSFGYVRTYLCTSLWNLFLSWSCRNFFFDHGAIWEMLVAIGILTM